MDFFFWGLFLCHWLWHSNSNHHLFYYPKRLNKHIIVPLLPHCHCEWKSCQTDGSRHETARLERSLNFGVSDSSEKATLTHLGCQVSSSHTAGQGENHCYNKCSIWDCEASININYRVQFRWQTPVSLWSQYLRFPWSDWVIWEQEITVESFIILPKHMFSLYQKRP